MNRRFLPVTVTIVTMAARPSAPAAPAAPALPNPARLPAVILAQQYAVAHMGGGGPIVNRGRWTQEEDELLREAVEKHGPKNWRLISSLMTQRTDVQCLHRCARRS